MNSHSVLKSSKVLLFTNSIFWLIVAIYFSFFEYTNNLLIVNSLLYLESIFYFIAFVGIIKRIKFIYIAAFFLALGNTILSITDQVGLFDFISLMLSGITFVNLILIWKHFFKSGKED